MEALLIGLEDIVFTRHGLLWTLTSSALRHLRTQAGNLQSPLHLGHSHRCVFRQLYQVRPPGMVDIGRGDRCRVFTCTHTHTHTHTHTLVTGNWISLSWQHNQLGEGGNMAVCRYVSW